MILYLFPLLLGLVGFSQARGYSAYDQLFPHYIELCGLSQIHKSGSNPGGVAGHSVLYIKGLCLDSSRGFPQVRICNEWENDHDTFDPENGVGISANKIFRNVNWVGFQGKKLFYDGLAKTGQPIDLEFYRQLKKKVVESPVFDGIEVHRKYVQGYSQWREDPQGAEGLSVEDYLSTKDMTLKEYIFDSSIGTDFGIRLGRNLACTRIPIERENLFDIAWQLNAQNQRYFLGSETYEWNVVKNSCAHLTINMLASIGYTKKLQTNLAFYTLHLLISTAIPANAALDLLEKAHPNDAELDLMSMYRDPVRRRAILNGEAVVNQPGTLAVYYPQWTRENELWNPVGEVRTYERNFIVPMRSNWTPAWPDFLRRRQNKLEEVFHLNEEYFDLEMSLRAFHDDLLRAKEDFERKISDREELPTFYLRYGDWIDEAISKTEKLLKRLSSA